MKKEEMVVNDWYLYKPLKWVFMFEKYIYFDTTTNVSCYGFLLDCRYDTITNVDFAGIMSVRELKDVEKVNIEDYIDIFPDDNPYKISFLRNKKIKSLLKI